MRPRPTGCSLEVGVLHARGDGDLLGIGIVDDVDPAHRRNAEIAEIIGAGIDELVRLRAGWRANDVPAANRHCFLAEPIFTLAGHDEEQLILHVMTVEWKRLLAGRNDVHRATQTVEPDKRPDTAHLTANCLPLPRSASGTSSILITVFSVIPTLPCRHTEMRLLV